jgi:hypothetical protein
MIELPLIEFNTLPVLVVADWEVFWVAVSYLESCEKFLFLRFFDLEFFFGY